MIDSLPGIYSINNINKTNPKDWTKDWSSNREPFYAQKLGLIQKIHKVYYTDSIKMKNNIN